MQPRYLSRDNNKKKAILILLRKQNALDLRCKRENT